MCVLEQSSIVVLDFVARDAEQPSSKRGRAAEAFEVLPCGDEYVLNQIVHQVLPGVQAPADKRVDRVGVRIDKLRCCLAVFLQYRGYKREIGRYWIFGIMGHTLGVTQSARAIRIDPAGVLVYSRPLDRITAQAAGRCARLSCTITPFRTSRTWFEAA